MVNDIAQAVVTRDHKITAGTAFTELTDDQLCMCLEEMRKRGWAVAAYHVQELGEGPCSDQECDYDEPRVKAWLAENREGIEDAMCEAVWGYAENEGTDWCKPPIESSSAHGVPSDG